MELVKARLISGGGNTAEVVMYFGEGVQRRSVTRHLQRVYLGHGWGRNPDEAAIARLDAAEDVWRGAVEAGEFFQGKLSEIEVAITVLKEKKADLDPREYRKARRELIERKNEAADKLADTLALSEVAKKAADKARAEVPRMVEFVF